MRNKLEANLTSLKEKLAALDRKLEHQPHSRYLRDVRNSYLQAINSAEATLQIVNSLDDTILNNVARLKNQEVY